MKSVPRKRVTHAKGLPKPTPTPGAVDKNGKPILVGCLVENIANHDDFGRVERVVEGIVLYRQVGTPDGHQRGKLCTWQNDELRVAEDPPADAVPTVDDEFFRLSVERALAMLKAGKPYPLGEFMSDGMIRSFPWTEAAHAVDNAQKNGAAVAQPPRRRK